MKYSISSPPLWVKSLSEEHILNVIKEDEISTTTIADGKGFCYLLRRAICTTNTYNEEYICRIYNLSQSDILQEAGVFEEILADDTVCNIHRISVIRDGVLINKIDSSIFRVLDNESQSSSGVINKLKKLNIITNDLQIGDIFVEEFTKKTTFQDDNFLNKKFFRSEFWFSTNYWVYRRYEFSLLQERDEPLVYSTRFKRDEKGDLLSDEIKTLTKGERFDFVEHDYSFKNVENIHVPYIEFATDTTWQEISTIITPYYEKALTVDGQHVASYIASEDSSIDLEDRIQACIEYVQNNIKYIYDAEDMHGHIPENIEKTLKDKMGDCKAKSILLTWMLRRLGLTAEVLLVNYNNDFYIPRSFASPFLFNHVIVRVKHNNTIYFIDPTWSDASGHLDTRNEPHFLYFVPLVTGAILETNTKKVCDGFSVEEHTVVHLKEDTGTIENTTTYRRQNADGMRKNFLIMSNNDILKQEHNTVLERMSFKELPEIDTIFAKDASITKVSDNKKTNEVVVVYKATLVKPYQMIEKSKIFKFYYRPLATNISSYKNKDVPILNTFSNSHKATLTVHSTLNVVTNDEITRKKCIIDSPYNRYFSFSNKKKMSTHLVEVVSELCVKDNGVILDTDLEQVKKDYAMINDSNYGVGIIYMSAFQSYFRGRYAYWWIGPVLVAFSHLIGSLSM